MSRTSSRSLTRFICWAAALPLVACSMRDANEAPPTASVSFAALRAAQRAPGFDFEEAVDGAHRARIGARSAPTAVTVTGKQVELTPAGGPPFSVRTARIGRAAAAEPSLRGARAEGQELVLELAGGVEERYLAGPLGLEQSF